MLPDMVDVGLGLLGFWGHPTGSGFGPDPECEWCFFSGSELGRVTRVALIWLSGGAVPTKPPSR